MRIDNSATITDETILALVEQLAEPGPQEEKALQIRRLLMMHSPQEVHQTAKYINNFRHIESATFNLIVQEENYIKKNEPVIADYFNALNVFNYSPYRVLIGDIDKPLNDLFVPLKLADAQLLQRKGKEVGLANFLAGAAKEKMRILLQGNPGSGKSTLLSYIALNAWEHPEKVGLPHAHAFIPLYVKAQHLAATRHPDLGKRLISAMSLSEFQMTTSMPDNFFTQWPAFLKCKWLLLIDGYDEIDEKYRNSLTILLNQLLELDVHIILATRPTFSLSVNVRDRFREMLIKDFDDAQRKELALNLLPNEQEVALFLSQLDAYDYRRIDNTPLMVTIATIIFRNGGHWLPRTEIELYQEYMDNYLGEAFSRNESIFLDSLRLKSTVLKVLKTIAFEMTMDSEQNSILNGNGKFTALSNKVADLIGERVKQIDRVEALELTANYIRALGKNAAIFQCTDNVCSWLHPTFREYLTACHIVEQGNALPDIGMEDGWFFLRRWQEDRWRKIVLFLLQQWSASRGDVSDAVGRILIEAAVANNEDTLIRAVIFCANALLCNVRVNEPMRISIYEHLTKVVVDKTLQNYCSRLLTHRDDVLGEKAIELIRQLGDDPLMIHQVKTMAGTLEDMARKLEGEGELELAVQVSVYFDLSMLGQLKSLMKIAEDESLSDSVRVACLYTLYKNEWWFKSVAEKTAKSNPAEFALSTACYDYLQEIKEKYIQIIASIIKTTWWNEDRVKLLLGLIKDQGSYSDFMDILEDDEFGMEPVYLNVPGFLGTAENRQLARNGSIHIFVRVAAALQATSGFENEYDDSLNEVLLEVLDQYGKNSGAAQEEEPLPEQLREKITAVFGQADRTFLKRVICETSAPFDIKKAAIQALGCDEILHKILMEESIDIPCRRLVLHELAGMSTDGEIAAHLQSCLQEEAMNCPDDLKMQVSLSRTLIRKGGYEEAEAALTKVTDMLHEMAEAFRLRGWISRNKGDYKEAIDFLDVAIQLDPEENRSSMEKAVCLMHLDKFREAISLFESKSYFDPSYTWAFVQSCIGAKDFEKAISLSDEYLEDNTDESLLTLRAVALGAVTPVSELTLILEDLNMAIGIAEDYQYAYYVRHLVHRRLGNFAEALEDLTKWMENHRYTPEFFQPASIFTMIHLRAENLVEAGVSLIKSKEYSSENPFILFTEALFFMLTGREQQAGDLLLKAREDTLRGDTLSAFLATALPTEVSTHALVSVLCGIEDEAQQCLEFLADNNERYQLINYTLPFIDDLTVLLNHKGAARQKAKLERRLFAPADGQENNSHSRITDPDLLYAPRSPRSPFPVPMYCSLSDIAGLNEEMLWGQKLYQYYKDKHPNGQERIVVLFNIKGGDRNDHVFGYCNFKQNAGAECDLKFSELEETMLRENLKVLVLKYGVEIFLFTHLDLAQRCRDVVERSGLIAKCLLIKLN